VWYLRENVFSLSQGVGGVWKKLFFLLGRGVGVLAWTLLSCLSSSLSFTLEPEGVVSQRNLGCVH